MRFDFSRGMQFLHDSLREILPHLDGYEASTREEVFSEGFPSFSLRRPFLSAL